MIYANYGIYIMAKLYWNFTFFFKYNENVNVWQWNENEMSGVLGHLCAHIAWTGAREPPEDSVMNEMTLPSRIWNSNLGGPRPSTLPLCHGGSPQYWIITSERGRNIVKLEGQSGVRTRNLRLSKHAALTTASGLPPSMYWHHNNNVYAITWFHDIAF